MFIVGRLPAVAAFIIRLRVRESSDFAAIKTASRAELALGGLWSTQASRRSTAQNVLWSAGRACGGPAPLVIGYAYTHIGFGPSLGLMACIYILDLVITLGLLPMPKAVEATRSAGPLSTHLVAKNFVDLIGQF